MKYLIALLCVLSLPLQAKTVEIDPLSVSVRTVWGKEVTTVEQAAKWILEPIGYRLVTTYPAPVESVRFAVRPIPPELKMHRTMPIVDVLQLLVGIENTVVVDRRNHLVSFEKGTK